MLKDIIYYILDAHPAGISFSNARITKLIYLADWKACLERGHQITDIEWFFDYYGPFVKDIEKVVEDNLDIFTVEPISNGIFGGNKKAFGIKNKITPQIGDEEKVFVDFIIEKTFSFSFSEFLKYVYSTYPIYKSRKFEKLNLPELAIEYKNLF